jgi:dienelactone hydrolase
MDRMDRIEQTMINFKIVLICVLVFMSGNVYSQCKLNPPDTLYRTDGIYSVVCDSIKNKRDKDDIQVYIFRPREKMDKSPLVILSHQFGNRSPDNYTTIINNLVSKGVIVLYPSSVIISADNERDNRYRSTFGTIESAVKNVSPYIDSTRIGVVAHGYGGGMAPSLLYKMIHDRKWGLNGAFMYIASPWYMNKMDLRQMDNFPEFVNIIIQVFDNDIVNDPDIAVDIFRNLNVSANNKRFIVMRSDKNERCELNASFSIPEGSITSGTSNFLDIYGINRIIDSLIAYSLYRDTIGFNFLFKKKAINEIPMGTWADGSSIKPMLITDSAFSGLVNKKRLYINPWRSLRNERLEQKGNRYVREIGQNYRKKSRQSIATFLKTQIRKAREDSTSTGVMENPITNSYGADGPYAMQADTVNNPYISKEQFSSSMPIYFFTPVGLSRPSPVIIFIHGYIGQNPVEFEPLLRHIVSLGYTVIYPSYSFLPKADTPEKVLDKYGYLYSGISKAARILSWRIDTTRVGFFGQSFGAGTIPAITYRLVNEKKWGKNGVFMFITAPWYSFDITEEQIKKIPSTAKLLMQVYDDDQINDHAMAVDLFNTLPIPASEKDYMTIYSDSLDGYVMQANHFVPYGPENIYGDLNAFDYYGIFKNFDALADYTFTGNIKAKNTALGNGSHDQVYMGMWSDNQQVKTATVTDTPKATHPELLYLYSWDNALNPRRINKTSEVRK